MGRESSHSSLSIFCIVESVIDGSNSGGELKKTLLHSTRIATCRSDEFTRRMKWCTLHPDSLIHDLLSPSTCLSVVHPLVSPSIP